MKRALLLVPCLVVMGGCAGGGAASPRQTVSEPPPPAAGGASAPVIYDAPPQAGAYTEPVASRPAAPALEGAVDYVVKEGDSLWKIAREQGSSVARIREANGLTGDVIRPGQVLKIPR